MDSERSPALSGPWTPDWRTDGVHLLVLWAFAVVQPLLTVLPRDAEFFIVRGVGGASLAAFVVLFAFVPPALLLGLELLVGRVRPGLRLALHLAFVWLLAGLTVLYPLEKRFFQSAGWSVVLLAAVIGAVATVLYARRRPARLLLTVLAPAPLIFLVTFLFFSEARKVILPQPAGLAPAGTVRPGSLAARTPIVVLVLDELPISSLMDRRGGIDAVRYPNLARLAGQSTWYRNTTTSADFTVRAVPAMLDGNRPGNGKVPVARDHPHTLFTLFGRTHRLVASERATALCPRKICSGAGSSRRRLADLPSAFAAAAIKILLPPRLTTGSPPLGLTFGEYRRAKNPRAVVDPDGASSVELSRHPEAQFERFLRLVKRGAKGGGRPPLFFTYAALPHSTWKLLPSGQLYLAEFQGRTPSFADGRWIDDPGMAAHQFQRHLLQVEDTDRELGRLMALLQSQGLYDRSLVVVAADHGSSFVAGEEARAVTRSNAADVGDVPFFVKAPGQRRGVVDDRHLETIDLVPTVAEVLGVRMPWRTDGRSARSMSATGRRTLRISGIKPGTGVSISASALDSQRRQTLKRRLRLFGSGHEEPGLFAVGPHPELLGKRPGAATTRRPPPVVLDAPDEFGHVDPRSRFVPVLVSGRLPKPPRAAIDLAVVVNGRVRATARTYQAAEGAGVRFAAMVPPSALRRGRNRVQVVAIR